MRELRDAHGGPRPVAELVGVTPSAVEAWAQGRRRPTLASLGRLLAVEQGDPPEQREARVGLMASRFAAGREPFTGRPAPGRRSCAEVVGMYLAADEDLLDQAQVLDRIEDDQDRREREALARGQELEDEEDGYRLTTPATPE